MCGPLLTRLKWIRKLPSQSAGTTNPNWTPQSSTLQIPTTIGSGESQQKCAMTLLVVGAEGWWSTYCCYRPLRVLTFGVVAAGSMGGAAVRSGGGPRVRLGVQSVWNLSLSTRRTTQWPPQYGQCCAKLYDWLDFRSFANLFTVWVADSNGGSCVWDSDASRAVCDCLYSFRGSSCTTECPLDEQGRVCSSHGMCDINGTCQCATGDWKGARCDEPMSSAGTLRLHMVHTCVRHLILAAVLTWLRSWRGVCNAVVLSSPRLQQQLQW